MSTNSVKKIYLPTILSTLLFLGVMAGAYLLVDSSLQVVYQPSRNLQEARYALAQTLQFVVDRENPADTAQLHPAADAMALVTERLIEIERGGRTDFSELVKQSEQVHERLVRADAEGRHLDDADWKPLLQDLASLQLRLELESQAMLKAIKDRFYDAFDQLDVYVAASALLVIAMWLVNSFWLVPRYAVQPLEALLKAQREQEAQVRQSEARMQAISNAVASGIVLAGEDGRIKFWNPSAERLLKCPSEVALGAPLDEILRRADGEPLPFLAEVPGTGSANHQIEQFHLRRHDGSDLAVSLYHTSTIMDGTPHTVVAFRDVTDEWELGAELKRRHSELQALYDNAPIMIGLVDETATILYANPAFIAYAGNEAGTCLGMRLGDALGCAKACQSPGGCDSVNAGSCNLREAVRSTLEGHDLPHEFEHHAVLRRDGQDSPVTLMGTAVRLEAGESARVLLCLQDITARKQTEEALRQSEARMALVLDAATDGWWDWDLASDQLHCSERWFEMLGYPADSPAPNSKMWQQLPHPEDLGRVTGQIQDALASGQPFYEIECRLRHAMGHYLPVLSRSRILRDAEGVPVRLCGFNIDLSEAKRHESEYESLIQTSMDGFWVADSGGRILRVNHTICEMLQYTEHELLRMNIADVEANKSLADIVGHIENVMECGHELFDTRLRRRDGSTFELEANVSSPPDSKGQIFAFMRDITQRKTYEATLQASEARFRSYIEHAPIGVVVVDRTGRYLEANDSALNHLGYTREEFLSLSISDLRVKEYAAIADQHFESVLLGENRTIEVLLRRKDGSNAPTEIRASRLDEDRFLGFHIDLSERKRAVSVMLHQAALDAVLAEISQAMVAEENGADIAEQILRHASRLAESTLSYLMTSGETPGSVIVIRPDLPALVLPRTEDEHDPDLPLLESLWSELGRVEGPCTTSLLVPPREVDAAGAPSLVKVLVLPILQGGEWLGQMVLADPSQDYSSADVTSLGRLAELYRLHMQGARIRRELETSRQQFLQAQKMEAVGRLAGGVAHDFNNILGVILGYSEFALRNEACNSELQEHLECMRKASLRGADLTRQLLAFARKQTVQPRKLDLNENVGAMLKLLGQLAGERITVHWHPLSQPLPIEMDPSQFDQLLANLIVNARDAMTGTGTITIATALEFIDDERGILLGNDRKSGHFSVLSVTDTGCGMDGETLNHIFEPFFTTKPEGQGTGLGLATVHGIVHQNGGFVTAESEPGQGTTFRIYLPIQGAGGAEGISHPEGLKGNPSGSETILLVDDQGDFRDACKTILESLGYRVITARNGDDALRSLNGDTDTIQLLITDLVMPGMNGRDLWAHLSARCPNLRCIYMSGYTADVIGEQGVLDESVCLIDKPFSMSTLAQRIREVLDA
jgi:PAS domain S-box-containing protein